MADDWIKLRTNLWDHPKVVRIVSAICPEGVRDVSLKCRVIGALYRTWCIADTHTKDGILDGYDAAALNADIGIDGWAESLQHVGWLIVETQRIIVPRFEDHNGESAKRRAEDAKRKRESRKASAERPKNVQKKPDTLRTREEKRREENIDNTKRADKPPVTFVIPVELNNSTFMVCWEKWVKHRKEIKKPLTETSGQTQLETFASWGQERAIRAIEHTIEKGWQGIREPEVATNHKPHDHKKDEPQYENLLEKRKREAEARRLEWEARHGG